MRRTLAVLASLLVTAAPGAVPAVAGRPPGQDLAAHAQAECTCPPCPCTRRNPCRCAPCVCPEGERAPRQGTTRDLVRRVGGVCARAAGAFATRVP